MHVFGLTGGIASGKSTVGARFRARGVPVIDADQVAREVVMPGTEGLAAVVAAFGLAVLLPDGSLDRARVGDIVFADAAKRATLNSIVHPRIAAASQAKMAALAAEGAQVVCYEAALLVENGLTEAFRPLVVVAANEDTQRRRIGTRDGLDDANARSRIAAQRPLAEKIATADVVVHNDGTLVELHEAADAALRDVLARLGVATGPYFDKPLR